MHLDLSTPSVLTMEWADGVHISDVDAIRAMGVDTKDVARLVRACSHAPTPRVDSQTQERPSAARLHPPSPTLPHPRTPPPPSPPPSPPSPTLTPTSHPIHPSQRKQHLSGP